MHIFNTAVRLSCLLCLLWQASSALAQTQKSYHVVDIQVSKAERTDIRWVREYVGLSFPRIMTKDEADKVRKKLLRTEVFLEVTTSFDKLPGDDGAYIFNISLVERWTTIPVVRGALGGGTDLKVFGVYDIHSFGRLLTLGAETHKYGTAPTGGVVWARSPRWLKGGHVLGLELWREFREHLVYDDDDERRGTLRSGKGKMRFIFMSPFTAFNPLKPAWKLGMDVRLRREEPVTYNPDSGIASNPPPEGIDLDSETRTMFMPMARLEYDSIDVNRVSYDGIRFIGLLGPQFGATEANSRAEHELFFYRSFSRHFNFALHYLIGQSTSESADSQYFLGGLESVRGIPEGAIYGTRAYYSNVELRYFSTRRKYMWLQNVLFYDIGGAGEDWSDAADSIRSSVGAGIRIALPQVYRLMLRIDYAWSLDKPGVHGVSAGMNQFFQPYRPL